MFQVRTRRSIRRKRIQRRKTSSDGRRSRVPDWQASYRCAIRYYYQVAAIPANKPSVEVLFVFFLFNARWEWMHGRIPSTATFFFWNLTILMIISKLSRKKSCCIIICVNRSLQDTADGGGYLNEFVTHIPAGYISDEVFKGRMAFVFHDGRSLSFCYLFPDKMQSIFLIARRSSAVYIYAMPLVHLLYLSNFANSI